MAVVEGEQSQQPLNRTPVLVGLVLTLALTALDSTVVATAVPAIVHDLSGFSLFPWLFSIYLLVQAAVIPIYGKLADIYGRKPILIAGTVIFLAGSALAGVSWSMVALIVFRGFQGIGGGAISSVTFTVVGDLYSVEERGRVQGWLSSVWAVAGVIGPLIGGFFAEYASWRWIFYLNLPVGAAALVVLVVAFHERVERHQHQLDVAGAALLAGGTGLVILGLLEGGVDWPWLSAPSVGIFALAAAALLLFVRQEQRHREPMMPLWVFRNQLIFRTTLAGGAVVGLIIIGLTTYLPTYAVDVLGTSAVVAGFIYGAMVVAWPIASARSNLLYMRIGFRDTALIGAAITVVAAVMFALLTPATPLWLVCVAGGVMGIGAGLMSTPLLVGIQSVVGWSERGVVTGTNMFGRQMGQALGAAIFGTIANTTLVNWFGAAPRALRAQLPSSLNAANSDLGNGSRLDAAAQAYLQHGLFLATRNVFIGLAIGTVLGLLVVAITPRVFRPVGLPAEAGTPGSSVPAGH